MLPCCQPGCLLPRTPTTSEVSKVNPLQLIPTDLQKSMLSTASWVPWEMYTFGLPACKARCSSQLVQPQVWKHTNSVACYHLAAHDTSSAEVAASILYQCQPLTQPGLRTALTPPTAQCRQVFVTRHSWQIFDVPSLHATGDCRMLGASLRVKPWAIVPPVSNWVRC